MTDQPFATHQVETARHRTAWIEAGPGDGPLMIFLHGWPMLSIIWRQQIEHFAAAGWRCVAPDMRGYGRSSVPTSANAYTVREIATDMAELHDALGGEPAVWVGHDWGSAICWAIASHHPERCCAAVNLCVPYLAHGLALPTLIPLVDRSVYPEDKFPVGQWDYWLYHREHFSAGARLWEQDVAATLTLLYQTAKPALLDQPAAFASVRANGGWFGPAGKAPAVQRDEALIGGGDFAKLVAAFETTGFRGADAWYMNDAANLAYAAEAPDFGRLKLPVLFIHADWDTVCNSAHSRLSAPMREDCSNLTEVTIAAGHAVMLEQPDAVNAAISGWLTDKDLR